MLPAAKSKRRNLVTIRRKAYPLQLQNPQTASEATCSIQTKCRSCSFINQPYKEALDTKFKLGVKKLKEEGFLRRAKVASHHASEQVLRYRTTMKLAVRKQADKVTIGLFEPGTHNVIELESCPVHAPILSKLLRHITDKLQELDANNKLLAWDEVNSCGDLRYIVIRTARHTHELQVTFVVKDTSKKALLRQLVKSLIQDHEFNINSAFLNINSEQGNQIYGDQFVKISGIDHLRVRLGPLQLQASPASFLQVNPWQAEWIYRRICDLIGPGSSNSIVWDLYCGIGPIGLNLARLQHRVWGVEENPYAISDAQLNLSLNGISSTSHLFESSRLEERLEMPLPEWAKSPSFIVVNPSRRGLQNSVAKKLGSTLAQQKSCKALLYLSCDLSTLIRDLHVLSDQGVRLRQIEAFDMFAHTDKLEWLAVLTK